jgi:hypothetical protein
MTLPELEALGCYMSAGFIDHYDGVHTRLGEATAGGDIVLYPESEAFLRTLAPVSDESVVEKPKARKGKKAEAEAPAAESEAPAAESEAPADSDDSQGALADLDALLAG